jgi:sporulation protein YlmC with PRC-barrel domain
MKTYPLIILLISVFAFGLVTVNAVAQEPISKTWTGVEVSKLLWSNVENPQGEYLGRVTDFVIDSSGRIEFAILLQGYLEIGDSRYVAVPFEALSYGPSAHYFVLDTTRERLASAPSFNEKKDLTNRKFAEDIYKNFGLEPPWTEGGHEKGIRSDQDPFDLVG